LTVNIYHGDCEKVLSNFADNTFDLIYIDPPFNTGKVQTRTKTKMTQSSDGDRTGYQGKKYKTEVLGELSFSDIFDDYIKFIEPKFHEAKRLLKPTGSFFFHIDYREAHYCKVLLDSIFDRKNFMNEIVWIYDFGARSKKKWSAKHDTIFWYAMNAKNYTYNFDDIDRIPYLAPGLVGPEKAAKGKTPTDSWWQTIVSPNGKEKTGYPTQKPIAILNRIIKVHSNAGDNILDFFAGSGTTGEAAARNDRNVTLVDSNKEAIDVMMNRLSFAEPVYYNRST